MRNDPFTSLLLLTLAACEVTSIDADSGEDSADRATNDTSADTEARTLDNCGGTTADDVPEPFASWFDCADWDADGTTLSVFSTGLPPHSSPYYAPTDPNYVAFDDQDGERQQNPNTLSTQTLAGQIPLEPTPKGLTITGDMVDQEAGNHEDEYRADFQGIGLDGTALFTGVAAPGDSITDEESTFDQYEGHPTNQGTYHHHGANPAALAILYDRGVVTSTAPGSAEIEFYGIMCDGTVVLGCSELDGRTPSVDLDVQNGHVGTLVTNDGATFFTNRYHVHACAALGRHLTPEIQYYEDAGSCL